MPIDPEDVVAGGWYRTRDGEERLVWTVRDGQVCYFHRDRPDKPWTCTQPAEPPPPAPVFAAEVELVHIDAGAAAGKAADVYGEGDW